MNADCHSLVYDSVAAGVRRKGTHGRFHQRSKGRQGNGVCPHGDLQGLFVLHRFLSDRVKAFIMPELNLGQMVLELERAAKGGARVFGIPHAGGAVHEPETILKKIIEVTP
jgi:hypothetical protein